MSDGSNRFAPRMPGNFWTGVSRPSRTHLLTVGMETRRRPATSAVVSRVGCMGPTLCIRTIFVKHIGTTRRTKLAFAALALAVGAEDDEVGAMWARLGPTEIPRHPQDAIAQMRATLREVRGAT
jgi:hypothetical protein